MLILGLDLARRTGFAFGVAGSKPEVGSWELRSLSQDDFHLEPPALARHLTRLTDGRVPDLIAVEDYMSPKAQKNERSIVTQLLLHGALDAWAGVSRIRVARASAGVIRMAVCGRASAAPPPIGKISKDHQRRATKVMVRDTLATIGLVAKTLDDFDASDAACVWAWAEGQFGGARRQLLLTP